MGVLPTQASHSLGRAEELGVCLFREYHRGSNMNISALAAVSPLASPPQANRVRYPVASLPYLFMRESWRTMMLWSAGFPGIFRTLPPSYLHSGAAPNVILIGSQDFAVRKLRTGFNTRQGHRIFASGNRAGRCRCSAGFLGDLPFPPPFNSGTAPYSLQSPSSALSTSLLRAAQISFEIFEKRGSYVGYTDTLYRSAIASTCKALNLRAVYELIVLRETMGLTVATLSFYP
ncbi:hypothetical protein PR048_021137 [Dryococelus australis]|uniref:Uncharacterized protein n=1 Tax=Dryococelus australis TaxID=614101 RepID=A0ABQ9GXD1_9NEOP|nr:hypothetical protein PR048_021137 [Dryococelus australis]